MSFSDCSGDRGHSKKFKGTTVIYHMQKEGKKKEKEKKGKKVT